MNLFRPNKNDIRQISVLGSLGCSKSDIAYVIGITENTLIDWEKNNQLVGEALKGKSKPEYTINHPDYAPMVEEAFTCAGQRFYRFKEEQRTSTGRYKYYYATLRELELKMNPEILLKYIQAFENILNGGKKNSIQIGELWKLVINMKSRVELEFDPKTIKELAAIAYFDETEDLTTYDHKHGQEKIALWEKNAVYDFFLTKPIGELFGLKNVSVESLEEYLKTADGVIQSLNSNLQTVYEENLSETGSSTSSD